MRRNYRYLILLILLGICAAVQGRRFFLRESVEQSGSEAAWDPAWYELISEDVNRERIRLEINGTRYENRNRAQAPCVRMEEDGHFYVPFSLLPDGFSIAGKIYQGTKASDPFCFVMEQGNIQAKLPEGSTCMTVNGKEISLQSEIRRIDGTWYVPAEALEKAFALQWDWDPEEYYVKAVTVPETELLPAAYDYRKNGRAPEVKNQGSLGTCWAFASMMALQSRLLPEQNLSFSEDHMSLQNSFRLNQNDGGEYTMSMAYLLAWQGPVPEEEDPYGDGFSPPGLTPVCHVQEIQVLPEKDYDEIKRAIFLYGGVQSSLYTSMAEGREDDRYYNKEEGAYCYRGTAKPNHDVVIIGWDDTYPKEKFLQPPEEDGAFICANSWGGDFGEDGYFYVSYFDSNIGIHNILYSGVEEADNYDTLYQTDLCGWVGQLGYGKDNAYFANVYTAKTDELLSAVGFYATGQNTSYEIYTVTDVDSSAQFGRKKLAASGQLDHAGYYTIPLRRRAELNAGERFAVIVKIETPGSVHPVAIEYNSPEKGMTAEISDGEGYISYRGTSWERVEEKQNCNVCLKAYTEKR